MSCVPGPPRSPPGSLESWRAALQVLVNIPLAAMIIRGSLERLAPVMMTATTSFVGLLPLIMGAGQTGKEILYPLALVVFGGMLTSTLLDQLVTPALFYRFGQKKWALSTSRLL